MSKKETTTETPPPTVMPQMPERMAAFLTEKAKRLQTKFPGKPIMEKMIKLSNGQDVPHCEDGPARKWAGDEACPEGHEAYYIRGQLVPEKVVMRPETLTIQEIKEEKNAEVRRIMRERFGECRYLQETGAKVIDADFESARKGAANRVLMKDDENQLWLVGTDGSTGRTYYMRVQDRIKTCREAHESLFGFPESVILAKS